MLFGKEGYSRKYQGKYLIGYEMGRENVQISYMKVGEKEPQTISRIAGMEDYNIPFVLYQKEDTGLWYYGREAIEKQKGSGSPLLTELLELACRKETVMVGEEIYKTAALLALFVKRSLSLLSMVTPIEKVAACTFTLDGMGEKRIQVLREMVHHLQLPGIEFHFTGKEESFFYYNLHTQKELWNNRVYLYEMEKRRLTSYCLSLNRHTTPVVTLIEKKEYPLLKKEEPVTLTEKNERDEEFLQYLMEDMEDKIVSTVYLIGEGFQGEWYRSSLRYLCLKRRVFMGNNLYSKGACLCLAEHLAPTALSKEYVYLGEDKLTANVGLEVTKEGKAAYLAVMDGGSSWHDSGREWDFIMEGDNRLRFKITPLNGKNIVYPEIVLEGLRFHKSNYCRIHVETSMETREKMVIKIWDRGFGEFSPSSGQYWEETILLL